MTSFKMAEQITRKLVNLSVEYSLPVNNIHLGLVIGPRTELHGASLLIEGEKCDVHLTWGLEACRGWPEHGACGRHHGIGGHVARGEVISAVRADRTRTHAQIIKHNGKINGACHPRSHHWGYCLGTPSLSYQAIRAMSHGYYQVADSDGIVTWKFWWLVEDILLHVITIGNEVTTTKLVNATQLKIGNKWRRLDYMTGYEDNNDHLATCSISNWRAGITFARQTLWVRTSFHN